MSGVELVKVKDIDDGMRLNRWFMKYYPKLSLGHLQKLLRTKQIKVDGKKAETSLKLAAGQEVRIPPLNLEEAYPHLRAAGAVSKKDAEFALSLVIYKDDNVLVLNKPSGIAVQGGTNTSFHIDGLLEALKFGLEERPRLDSPDDKDTSRVWFWRASQNCRNLIAGVSRASSAKNVFGAGSWLPQKTVRGD